MRGLAVCALLAASATRSGATVYEVDRTSPQCSDSGPGTSAIPLCTIGAGAGRAVAGDTVSVHSGTYAEDVQVAHSGTSSLPIVLRAASGAAVTVTSSSYGFEVSGRSWVRIEGFTVSGTVRNGISIEGSSNVTVSSNVVTGSGRPQNNQTEPAIYVSGSSNCTISGNVLHHNSDAGVHLVHGSTGNLIADNVCSYNARGYTRAAPGIDVRSGGNTIRGNICHHNEDSGIQVYGDSGAPSPNNVVVNNLCYSNGDHGIDVSSAGSQKIVGNTVYLSVTSGINVEGPSTGSLVANNISVDNAFGTGKGNIRVDPDSTSGTTVDYDVVYLSQSGQTQIVWGSSSYATLAAFRSATGQEAHGKEANPLFVSPSTGNFHVQAFSPAIDCANSGASGALPSDLEGTARVDDPTVPNTGAGPRSYDDRGAYEFEPVAICGNGIREPGEACDGSDLGGASCISQGFYCGSELACSANCTFNTASCLTSCSTSDACHVAACDAPTGTCTQIAVLDGTACDDGNACTASDACHDGLCAGTAVPPPEEADDGLRLSQLNEITTISWNPAPGSSWTDIVRGVVSGLPVGSAADSCLGSGIVEDATTDPSLPPSGDAFWYLIRGGSVCGSGPYGFQIVGGVPIPRITAVCP